MDLFKITSLQQSFKSCHSTRYRAYFWIWCLKTKKLDKDENVKRGGKVVKSEWEVKRRQTVLLQLQKQCVFSGSGLLLNVLLAVRWLKKRAPEPSWSLHLILCVSVCVCVGGCVGVCLRVIDSEGEREGDMRVRWEAEAWALPVEVSVKFIEDIHKHI